MARPLALTMEELRTLSPVELVSVVECAGNGRAFYEPTSGAPWPAPKKALALAPSRDCERAALRIGNTSSNFRNDILSFTRAGEPVAAGAANK